ncbi:MAG: hypothetical protein ACFFD4_01850 [Candidatus Odinarchaeota archaeon]
MWEIKLEKGEIAFITFFGTVTLLGVFGFWLEVITTIVDLFSLAAFALAFFSFVYSVVVRGAEVSIIKEDVTSIFFKHRRDVFLQVEVFEFL